MVVGVASKGILVKRGGRNGGNFNVPFLLIDVFSRRSRFCPRLGEEEEEVLSFSYRISLLLCGMCVRRESSEKYPISVEYSKYVKCMCL